MSCHVQLLGPNLRCARDRGILDFGSGPEPLAGARRGDRSADLESGPAEAPRRHARPGPCHRASFEDAETSLPSEVSANPS